MQRIPFLVSLVLASFTAPSSNAEPVAKNSASMIRQAQQAIKQYHLNAVPARSVIRVVYFHPSDQPPLPNWRPRLTRIAEDVERFYNEGLAGLGANQSGVHFEKDKDGYVFHVVRGKRKLKDYSYESGAEIENEVHNALGQKINFKREHVLAIHGLCRREENGRYVFNAPYYGRGTQRNGFCHAADCELLDPAHFPEKKKKIVYAEHYYPRVVQTLGKFNTWYIGGIAHELGHGLGLPHDAGPPAKRFFKGGFTLMGSGNHHYREDRRGEKRPAYLGLGSGLRLLSNPLVTGSDRGRLENPGTRLTSLNFSQKGRTLTVDGEISGSVPAYAGIVYLWRPKSWPGNPQKDHNSISFPVLVSGGNIHFETKAFKTGDYRLRISVLHCNGADTDFDFHLSVNRKGAANIGELNSTWLLSRAETAVLDGEADSEKYLSEQSIARTSPPIVQAKLRILRDLAQPPPLIDLKTTKTKAAFLSDATWKSAQVGWGEVARNHYNRNKEGRNSIYLELQGKFYAKGLYAHSESSYTFDLTQRWKTLTTTVGLRDGAGKQGSAIFTVLGDGKPLCQSKILRVGESETLEADLSGVSTLELKAEGGEGHAHNSWAIWTDPIVKR